MDISKVCKVLSRVRRIPVIIIQHRDAPVPPAILMSYPVIKVSQEERMSNNGIVDSHYEWSVSFHTASHCHKVKTENYWFQEVKLCLVHLTRSNHLEMELHEQLSCLICNRMTVDSSWTGCLSYQCVEEDWSWRRNRPKHHTICWMLPKHHRRHQEPDDPWFILWCYWTSSHVLQHSEHLLRYAGSHVQKSLF